MHNYNANFQADFQNQCVTSIYIITIHHCDLVDNALRCDKVSMLTHTYQHKPLRKIKVAICNNQVDSLFYLWHVCSGDLLAKKKSMVVHDTECPY